MYPWRRRGVSGGDVRLQGRIRAPGGTSKLRTTELDMSRFQEMLSSTMVKYSLYPCSMAKRTGQPDSGFQCLLHAHGCDAYSECDANS